ncbi:uncharacterized protein BXZ73DRAFT_42712 [Epithele typhae]|uniref:uncharacterized protein n=1 Tax=Epithele typhae TaxID=378194 RepID=UPI00200794B3|nr:uncharacterized protein BXZ73DRAFT_42712 [Epithele typhae]KAH9940525.1 hypothetical protein BXZ73DRAFT_42712 [Epithele typhae]
MTTTATAASQTAAQGARAPSVAPAPPSELALLRSHIQTLTELNSRLQAIRQIPAQLLRPPPSAAPGEVIAGPSLLTHGFKELQAVGELVRSEKVQEALKTAKKSERADSSALDSNLRREMLKRRRPPPPDSPQPYRETEPRDMSFLPPPEDGAVPISLEALPAYVRNFNRSNKNKLHIVSPKKGRALSCPVTLRLMAVNVATIYLTVDHSAQDERALIVESATAIGSREQASKPAHSQSDFMAFQQLSQQLAKVIRSDPLAPLQSFIELLGAYDRLFDDSCSNCQRVISAEGHVPPVVRRRVPPSADGKGPQWDARHVVCKYEPPPPAPPADEGGGEVAVDGVGEGGASGNP